MKKIDLGQTITILANIGVISGLIFVAFQLRQDREIATIDSVGTFNDSRIYSYQLQAENAGVWVRGLADDSLSAEESVIFNALAEAHLQFYFSSWLRNTRIGTPESAERWVREAAFDIVSSPGLSKWWQRSSERAAKINPGGRWDSAVKNEIHRLEQQRE